MSFPRKASLALAVLIGLALLGTALLLPPAGPEPVAEAFALDGVEVVEPALGREGDRRVVVRNGRIESIDAAAAGATDDTPVVGEYRGSFVLPGLIDMHTHLPPDTMLNLTEYFGLLYLLHGVTTVRDAGDLDGSAVDVAWAAHARGKAVPRITSCGPFVGGANPRWDNAIVVESPDDAPEILGRLQREGRTCIKIYDDLDTERIRALVRTANALGIAAIGHVPFGLTFEEAALPDTQHLMGVAPPRSIEAGDHVVHRIIDWRGVDRDRIDEVVRISRDTGVAHTPTLVSSNQLHHFADYEAARLDPTVRLLPRMYRDVTWNPDDGLVLYRGFGPTEADLAQDALVQKKVLVRLLHEAGVPVHVGTDTQQPFVVPGASMWQEMRLLADAGIPPAEIWAHATWRAGRSSGIERLGRVVEGAPAHLLIFTEDPTQDLAALESLQAVVVDGRLYSREQLEAAVERFQQYYENPVIDRLSVALTRRVLARAAREKH